MDVFGYVPRLPSPGETLRGTRLAYAPGGKGANQAVAAARVGATVRFTSACGGDDFLAACVFFADHTGPTQHIHDVHGVIAGQSCSDIAYAGEHTLQCLRIYIQRQLRAVRGPEADAAVDLSTPQLAGGDLT